MKRLVWGVLAVGLALAALNASMLAPAGTTGPRWLAHRGVHQTFSLDGVDNDTCTAQRIRPPPHAFMENTLPSMAAAYAAGADTVELDLHSSSDGHLVVFHDHELSCRTDLSGPPESQPLAALRTADVGYGYTADGGQTFPLRGRGVGLMPVLEEVLDAFGDRGLIFHLKTNDPADGDRLADALLARPAELRARWWVYGGAAPVERVLARVAGLRAFSTPSVKACLLPYLAYGWAGVVPDACQDAILPIPVSHAWLLWGWPLRFQARMTEVGADVVLVGPLHEGRHVTGIDDEATLARVPRGWSGWIWTNRIEALGPRAW